MALGSAAAAAMSRTLAARISARRRSMASAMATSAALRRSGPALASSRPATRAALAIAAMSAAPVSFGVMATSSFTRCIIAARDRRGG
jgi:hypothetical protein